MVVAPHKLQVIYFIKMPIHLRAKKGQVAPFVIVCGEGARVKFIAENFLTNTQCYTEYRHLLGYSGTYNGLSVSVQTTGMGIPSSMIVFEELVMLGAKTIIRIGTCGGLQAYLKTGDSIVGISAWGSSSTIARIVDNRDYSPIADFGLSNHLFQNILKKQQSYIGPIISNDLFYLDLKQHLHPLTKLGCLAVDNEAAGLFALGAKHQITTGCILTVSDLVYLDDPVRADDSVILEGVKKNVEVTLETFCHTANIS